MQLAAGSTGNTIYSLETQQSKQSQEAHSAHFIYKYMTTVPSVSSLQIAVCPGFMLLQKNVTIVQWCAASVV